MANAKHISIDGTTYDVVPAGANVTGVKGDSETTYRSGNVNITKSNIGLGNVPDVSTNNQTPTFTQASTRANIASGETLAVIFGKIMKFFADLKTVAFSGSYTDLSNKPTIPTVNNATLTIQKNGTNVQTFTANQSTNATANITMSKSDVGLGNVPNVATNNQTPTFTQASTRANIASGETLTVILGKVMKFFADLKTVAFSGSYTDLSNKPTIPTVNNATLTIQRNGTNVQTFTANSSSNKTANINCNSISALKTVSKTGVSVPANGFTQVILAHTAGSTDNCIITNFILQGAYQAHVFSISTDNDNIYVNIGNTTSTPISNLIVEVWYRIRS